MQGLKWDGCITSHSGLTYLMLVCKLEVPGSAAGQNIPEAARGRAKYGTTCTISDQGSALAWLPAYTETPNAMGTLSR